jgi:tetratricopeptide (TPR) repeat protein
LNKGIIFGGAITIIAGQFMLASNLNPLAKYFYNTSNYNKNVVKGLDWLYSNSPSLNDSRILISGLQGPYHAFRQEPFITKVTNISEYSLLLRNSERSWNSYAKNLGKVVGLHQLKIEVFDRFIIYSLDGKIRYSLSKAELMSIPLYWREPVIFCAVNFSSEDIPSSEIDKAMKCFDHSNEHSAAIRLGLAPGIAEKLGWIGLYHLGKSYIAAGEFSRAREYLEKAKSKTNHPLVDDVLNSIEKRK